MCHLARVLARRGHHAELFSFAPTPQVDDSGALTTPLSRAGGTVNLPRHLISGGFDLVVVKNGLFEWGPVLRRHLAPSTALWAWTGHAHDQPAMAAWGEPEVARAFGRIVFLTQWQADAATARFPLLDQITQLILRHAIAPRFETMFADFEDFRAAKQGRLQILAYTSTPFRGLDVLLATWPHLHARIPSAELRVHSSMAVYGVSEAEDPHHALYARAASLPGVRLAGSLPQATLAQAMRGYGGLAYLNTFPETGCIALMEALAAGLRVVTSALGALPETSEGWARLLPVERELPDRFIDAWTEELEVDEEAWLERQWAQVQAYRQNNWAARADAWEQAFASAPLARTG